MASPSIPDMSSPSRLVLIRVSSNSWMISLLCSISVWCTNFVNPLMSGIKSSPLLAIFSFKVTTFPSMKVIIAPDKFKGSLTSFEVCEAIAAGIGTVDNTISTLRFPMADGGDGFAAVMKYYLHTETIRTDTQDPLGRPITAVYELDRAGGAAIIELASASG